LANVAVNACQDLATLALSGEVSEGWFSCQYFGWQWENPKKA
jgi:hypothetical protein